MEKLLQDSNAILMECSVIEILRRFTTINLHPTLLNSPLIYDQKGKNKLLEIYQSYIEIAKTANLPIVLCTPTWRANHERLINSDEPSSLNIDSAKFMTELRDSYKSFKNNIFIGGMIGCKNDCYTPEESLSAKEAKEFHSWQIQQLVDGNVDFIIAATLPAVDEALGIAQAMEEIKLPYIISFVISRNGRMLDKSPLTEAIEEIDSQVTHKPLGYMVNCAFPSFLCPETQPKKLFKRLIGFQGNASSLDHEELEEAKELHADSVETWGDLMIEMNQNYGVKILGGCCGTGKDHLSYIVKKLALK
jgi:S-methylmethionine-dependent homocysteine/selenocysteine methylase